MCKIGGVSLYIQMTSFCHLHLLIFNIVSNTVSKIGFHWLTILRILRNNINSNVDSINNNCQRITLFALILTFFQVAPEISQQGSLGLYHYWPPTAEKFLSLSAGFEPARGNPNGFLVHRLNHSATTTCKAAVNTNLKKMYELSQLLRKTGQRGESRGKTQKALPIFHHDLIWSFQYTDIFTTTWPSGMKLCGWQTLLHFLSVS